MFGYIVAGTLVSLRNVALNGTSKSTDRTSYHRRFIAGTRPTVVVAVAKLWNREQKFSDDSDFGGQFAIGPITSFIRDKVLRSRIPKYYRPPRCPLSDNGPPM